MDESKQGHTVGVSDHDPQHGDGTDAVHALEGIRVRPERQETTSVGVDRETNKQAANAGCICEDNL